MLMVMQISPSHAVVVDDARLRGEAAEAAPLPGACARGGGRPVELGLVEGGGRLHITPARNDLRPPGPEMTRGRANNK